MKVFISYSSSDRLQAFELFRILEDEKFDVWLDYFDIMPTEKLENELKTNISQADVVCILFSPNSMASKWVEYEVKAATEIKENPPRLLGVIVHSCQIPDYVSGIIHLDARTGINDPIFIARVKRAINRKDLQDPLLILDAAKKEELSRQAIIERANTELPLRVNGINVLKDKPITDISITIDPDTFNYQDKVVYELRLNLDRLFNSPIYFFFTKYEEGGTWPGEFGFSEPSYKEFFMGSKPKIAGKMKWYSIAYDFISWKDGTDFNDSPANFSFEFTGQEFNKGKQGMYATGRLDFPTLGELLKDNCTFELIGHYPATKSAKFLDHFNAEIDLNFQVHFKEEKKWLTVFKSRHTRKEELAYGCNFVRNNENMIFKELLIQGFDPPDDASTKRKSEIATTLEEEKELAPQDFSLGGFYASSQGDLYFFRTDYFEASKWYHKGLVLLQPAVFQKFPTYLEATTLFHCCERLADCVDINRNANLKATYLNNLVLVAEHLMQKFSKELDYKRLLSIAYFRNAEMNQYLQSFELAAGQLRHSIETWESIHAQVPSAENHKDVLSYKTAAIERFSNSPVARLVPLEKWKKDLPESTKNKNRQALNTEKSVVPVWLEDITLDEWTVKEFQSDLLRYSIAVPDRFEAEPLLSSTQMEVNHLFKGPWPSEFLSVWFMEKAISAKSMTGWVENFIMLTGLPIIEFSTATKPTLSEWMQDGTGDELSKKYGVDEAHSFSGIIDLQDADKHRARVYILLLRRGTMAWKFILSMETALLPGMSADIVYREDHRRAGSTFGKVAIG